MTERVYIATEGPHDVELVRALLRPEGFRRVQHLSALDPYWIPLIPTTFPHKDDLLARMPIPTFLISDKQSVAVHAVGGDSKLAPRTEETLALLRDQRPAVAVLLDADSAKTVMERFRQVASALRKIGLDVPQVPGVLGSEPRCGVFVLPDNTSPGTFESLLLECADKHYPQLQVAATTYVDNVDQTVLSDSDLEDFRKPSGREKAVVSSMAAILRPGKAIQVSLQDNAWLRGAALELPRLANLRGFLLELLGLPRAAAGGMDAPAGPIAP